MTLVYRNYPNTRNNGEYLPLIPSLSHEKFLLSIFDKQCFITVHTLVSFSHWFLINVEYFRICRKPEYFRGAPGR